MRKRRARNAERARKLHDSAAAAELEHGGKSLLIEPEPRVGVAEMIDDHANAAGRELPRNSLPDRARAIDLHEPAALGHAGEEALRLGPIEEAGIEGAEIDAHPE